MSTWIYHPKLRRRVQVNLKGKEVRRAQFREFAERILEHFDKIIDEFNVDEARKVGGVGNWGTAKDYLEIMENNGMLKAVSTEPKPAYIVGCTPEEELQALVQSVGSRIAARRYVRVQRLVERSSSFLKSQPIVRIRENRPLLRVALELTSQRLNKSWE
jgi:hypothetical protein